MYNPSVYLMGLPHFALYMSIGVLFMVAFMVIYSKVTPHKEWKLMLEGNATASIAFSGAVIGFSLPLYKAMSQSVSLLDFAVWSLVALIIQLAAFYGLRGVLRVFGGDQGETKLSLCQHIEQNHRAYGIFACAFFIAIGMLNAASMTY